MRFSLTSLVRLCALLGLVASASAVGVSRAVPKVAAFRPSGPPQYIGVNGAVFDPPHTDSYLLDCESGLLNRFDPVPGHRVEFADSSPWADAPGGELIARLSPRSKECGEACDPSGLARVALAGGAVRREVPGGPVVDGPACWIAGSVSKVVFPGGDGRLYYQELAPTDDEPDRSPAPPKAITWASKRPGQGGVAVFDPVYLTTPGFDGYVLVALNFASSPIPPRLGPTQVWWLRLDPTGTKIVDSGRVTPDDDPGIKADEERFPSVGVGPDGGPVLAYLTQSQGTNERRLRVAPLGRTEGGAPIVRRSEVRDLGDGLTPMAAAFSRNGRSLYAITRRAEGDGGHVRRVLLSDVLGAPARGPMVASGR